MEGDRQVAGLFVARVNFTVKVRATIVGVTV